jgi:hypothetical protein
MRHARMRGIAAGDGHQLDAIGRSDRRHVLVARDLAEADDGDAKRAHDFSPDPAAVGIAGAAPDGAAVPS